MIQVTVCLFFWGLNIVYCSPIRQMRMVSGNRQVHQFFLWTVCGAATVDTVMRGIVPEGNLLIRVGLKLFCGIR